METLRRLITCRIIIIITIIIIIIIIIINELAIAVIMQLLQRVSNYKTNGVQYLTV